MSAYCKQCSVEIFGEDFKELAGIASEEDDRNDMVATVLCEGCGPTRVNSKGECIYHKGRTQEECFWDTQK